MNKLRIVMVMLLSVVTLSVQAQKKEPKVKTIVIQTSAECGDCEERIEGLLNFTKGISYSELDLETMKLTVKFKPAVITEAEIKDKISKLGYDADEVKAEHEAMMKLPECCRPNGMEKHSKETE
jgi:copper chaperone CopZ